MCCLFLIVLGTMTAAGAQDEPKKEPTKKQEPTSVVVEGKKPLTVQDEKQAADALEKVPGGVDFIPGEEIRKARAADMRDVLQGSPGVFISPRHGQEYRLSIRGSGLQRNFHLQGIKLLEDGIPVNLADGFGDFNTVDPRSMEYAEVYRGANAFPWGSTTLGGAINFVNRTGRTASAFDARIELGSWTHINAQLAAGHVAEPFDVYASAGHYGEEGFRPHSEFDTQRLGVNVGWRIADEWDTRMYLVLVRTVSEIPGTLTQAQVHHDRRASNFLAESQDWHRDMDNVRLANKTTWKSGDQQLDFGAYWMYTDLFHPLIWIPGVLNLGIIDQLTNDGGFFARYTNDQKIAGSRNSLVVGAQISGNQMRDIRYQNPNGQPGAPQTANGQTWSQNYTGYVQDQFWITEPLSIVAGFQGTFTTRRYNDNFLSDADGDQSFRARFTGVTPMAGARYQVTPTSQIYGNVSRVFEPPQFTELLAVRGGATGSLFHNQLRAQRGTSAEIGTRGKEGQITWDVAYYYAWLHREMTSFAFAPFPGATMTNNANRTAHQGLELAAQVDLPAGFFIRPGYTWSHFKFRNDPTFGDNHLPGVPEHLINLEVGFASPCGAFISMVSEIAPRKYPADYANSVFADRYATYGIRLGYRRDTGVSFFAEIRNITDQRYVSSVNQVADAQGLDLANFHPAFARAYYVGAEVRW